MKRIIMILTLGFAQLTTAQTIDYTAETLALFTAKDWTNLIELGEEAIQKKQSSYVIEYRLAVAYYNTNQYFDSAKYFENIQKTYAVNNDYILEYLYYSYLFTGRNQDALFISKSFPFHLKQKIGVKNFEFIDYISSEIGIKLSDRKNIGIENLSYFNIGLGQKLGYYINVNHAYTELTQNYLGFDYKQREYYVNAKAHVARGLTLIPAYHYIGIFENTASARRNNSPVNFMNTTRANDEAIYLLYFGLKKQWNRFSIVPNISYSNSTLTTDNSKETVDRIQYGLDMGYTVKGLNDKLWLGFDANILDANNKNDFIWGTKAYYQINPKAFFYVRYLNANTSNFSENNGEYYYNSVSILTDKIGITYNYHFTPKFSWFINYQYENAEDLENDILFSYNTLITGLKYDF